MVDEQGSIKGMDDNDPVLTLAAEECSPTVFEQVHRFGKHEERIIRNLIGHGPVLIRGGRGSGKSALLMEASNRIRNRYSHIAFAVYVSLRYLPLFRYQGEQYERNFCDWLGRAIKKSLKEQDVSLEFSLPGSVSSLQTSLDELARRLRKRVVLLFDDAAHIGRTAPLSEFFDIFRILSTDTISCKAAIYPGVTQFGELFDVYNDATVIDVIRDERGDDFEAFFVEVIRARYPSLAKPDRFSGSITVNFFAKFLGRSVLGNIRALVIACAWFDEKGKIGYPDITAGLLHMSSNHYWPLFEEVFPKLGKYEPMVDTSKTISEKIFKALGEGTGASFIVHKDIAAEYSKPLEILEYIGFIARRDASRAMKSGGRGVVYMANLCTVLEVKPGSRVTEDLLKNWLNPAREMLEIHVNGDLFNGIHLPEMSDQKTLSIFGKPVDVLAKSNAYPYGLTQAMISMLRENGFNLVGDLAEATDEQLDEIYWVGRKTVKRIRNVLDQAIWM